MRERAHAHPLAANASSVHIDGRLLEPAIELDGRPLIRGGELIASDSP
jgi:hypothetical protein